MYIYILYIYIYVLIYTIIVTSEGLRGGRVRRPRRGPARRLRDQGDAPIHLCIYIYIERERGREIYRERER